MSKEQADKYIKFMINLTKEKCAEEVSICLFGGESLINFEISEYILNEINKYRDENKIRFTNMIITSIVKSLLSIIVKQYK